MWCACACACSKCENSKWPFVYNQPPSEILQWIKVSISVLSYDLEAMKIWKKCESVNIAVIFRDYNSMRST